MINGDDRQPLWREDIRAARLSDTLYQHLSARIEGGEFGVGARLPSESDLAERFSMSRSMVREALSRLRESGTIVSRKGAGSFVLRPSDAPAPAGAIGFGPATSLAQVKKGYEFRIGLEGEAAFWAAQNRTPEALARMKQSLERLEEAIERRDVGVEPDYSFHLAVAQASANEFFETVLVSMRVPMTFAINLSRSLSLMRPVTRLRIVQAEHVAIYKAIEAGDGRAASAAMRAHIGNTCNRVFEGEVDKFGGPLPP